MAILKNALAVAAPAACLSRSRRSRVTEQDSIATDSDSESLSVRLTSSPTAKAPASQRLKHGFARFLLCALPLSEPAHESPLVVSQTQVQFSNSLQSTATQSILFASVLFVCKPLTNLTHIFLFGQPLTLFNCNKLLLSSLNW